MIPSSATKQGDGDARIRCDFGFVILLCGCGGADTGGASAAHDPDDRERGAGRAQWGVRGALRRYRAAVDRAGTAVAGFAVAGVLLCPLRAPVDGADQLQSSVSLISSSPAAQNRAQILQANNGMSVPPSR